MSGILYGIGVGSGDPELLTLKAINKIKECEIIAIPSKDRETCVAYNIVKAILPEIEEKEILPIHMPMTKEKNILENSHKAGRDLVIGCLNQGKNVGFLTLGDPSIYSTYLYIHELVGAVGYQTEIINGIPSFLAVAARLNCGLVNGAEELHIIPASYDISGIKYKGTKVLMKSGSKLMKIKEQLKTEQGFVALVENCGMENEHIYNTPEEIKEPISYYSTIIIKDDCELH